MFPLPVFFGELVKSFAFAIDINSTYNSKAKLFRGLFVRGGVVFGWLGRGARTTESLATS